MAMICVDSFDPWGRLRLQSRHSRFSWSHLASHPHATSLHRIVQGTANHSFKDSDSPSLTK